MYNRPIYYLQCTWYIGRPSTTYLVYWSIGHPVLAHMSDNRLVQETYTWGVGTLTVIFRGKNRYFKKKCNRGRRLLEFLICWRNIYVLLANTKKNICFKTTTKYSQRKQELYWQMQRQGVKMSNYFFLFVEAHSVHCDLGRAPVTAFSHLKLSSVQNSDFILVPTPLWSWGNIRV